MWKKEVFTQVCPQEKIKDIDERLMQGEVNRIANNYVMYSGWFKG
jgi:hypothetical protein